MELDVFKESSKSQKEIISFLYRFILIVYSSLILLILDNNYSFRFEAFYFTTYPILFIILFKIRRFHFTSFIRLLNDYLFIGLTILNIGEINILTYSLLFIPILNAQNHSGNKKSILLYLLPISIIFYLENKVSYSYFLPFFVFLIINSFEKIKNRYQLFYNELNGALDNFLMNEDSLSKLHKIYQEIIPLFNKYSFFSKEIKDIYCFQKSKETLFVVNGSSFIFNFSILKEKELLDSNKKIIYDSPITLNGNNINQNVFFKINKNSIDYIFLIVPINVDDKIQLNRLPFFYKLLFPFFFRLSHIFNFKRIQNNDNKKNFENIAKKVTYVNNAINSMHFTRNKLGPIKNYISMIEDYENTSSASKKNMIEPYLKEERKKMKTSIELILGRANNILEKSNNPFNVLDSNNYSFLNILSKVREASNYHLDSSKFIFKFEDFNYDILNEISVNETGIDLVLSNWLSNVNKFKSDDYYGVNVSNDDFYYYLTFFNKFTRKTNKEIPTFVSDFNSNDRMAILKRNTHGLIEIKDFLEQMGIESEMYVEESVLNFKIGFEKLKV